MRFAVATIAVWATISGFSTGHAQSLASVGGPRELPPASYTGQQYVDSRGCVFLKAGYGGQVNWVPRVNAQRKALCGFPPTFGKSRVEIAEAAPAPAPRAVAPAPVVAPKPRTPEIDPAIYTPAPYNPPGTRTVRVAPAPGIASPAPAPTVRVTAPAPYSDRAPSATYEVARSGPGAGQIGCFTSAPVAEVVRLRNGGTAVVCTRGDGGVAGWRSPIYPAGSRVGAALTDPVARVAHDPARVSGSHVAHPTGRVAVAAAEAPHPPKGYKNAWTDDRLNPNRGIGTASGQAAQDQIWTRTVPQKLVSDQPQRKKARVTVSTKSAPATQLAVRQTAAPGGALVQVGTFGVASNADGAAARLASLGLPVAKGRTSKGLQVVFAGPFGSGAEAQAALSAARRAGFSDAFLR
jgi:cell division protein FtsN